MGQCKQNAAQMPNVWNCLLRWTNFYSQHTKIILKVHLKNNLNFQLPKGLMVLPANLPCLPFSFKTSAAFADRPMIAAMEKSVARGDLVPMYPGGSSISSVNTALFVTNMSSWNNHKKKARLPINGKALTLFQRVVVWNVFCNRCFSSH